MINIHRDLKPCSGVKAFIKKDNKLLILRHAPHKNEGKIFWGVPGGHIDWDEDPESALKREAKEELGVEIKIEKILFSWKKIINPKHQVILIAYQCSLKDPEAKFTLTPDDDQYHWFSFDELEKYFPAGDQQYRQAILKYYQLK